MSRRLEFVQAAPHRGFQHFRLLVNLLEHVVLVAALIGIFFFPFDPMDVRLDMAAFGIDNPPVVRGDLADLAILQVNDILGEADKGAGIAGEEVFAAADAEHEGAAEPRR